MEMVRLDYEFNEGNDYYNNKKPCDGEIPNGKILNNNNNINVNNDDLIVMDDTESSIKPTLTNNRDTMRDMVHHRAEHLGWTKRKLLRRKKQRVNNKDGNDTFNSTNGASPATSMNRYILKSEDQVDYSSYNNNNDPPLSSTSSSLGDIMSGGWSTIGPRLPLAETYGFQNPLDRLVLTANGNLQRLISSYYDSQVSVSIKHCVPRTVHPIRQQQQQQQQRDDLNGQHVPKEEEGGGQHVKVWDRLVHLSVLNQTFCVATSVVTVRDSLCIKLVDSETVGLGQLFRYLDLLPEFCLLRAHKLETGGFWREYTLSCPELSCLIREEFIDELWNLSNNLPPPSIPP